MVYSMPAQPPFFTPMRKPVASLPDAVMSARMRLAAASVSVMSFGAVMVSTWDRLWLGSSPLSFRTFRCPSEHIERKPRLVRHAARVPRRIEHEVDLHLPDTGDGGDGVLHPARHVTRHGAAWRGERHVHLDIAFGVDVEAIDEPKLVNVDRDLRVEHGLQRRDKVVLELVVLGHGGDGSLRGLLYLSGRLGNGPLLIFLNLFNHFWHLPQA